MRKAITAATLAALVIASGLAAAPAVPPSAHHHTNHSWPISAKLKPGLRLMLLKRVKAHDRWVQGTAGSHHAGVVSLHHRQLSWTLKRIAKAKRQIREGGSGPIPWYWLALHNCEQPGSWHHYGPGARASGGIGILAPTWSYFRLPGYPSTAYYATPWQQINVARALMRYDRRHGFDVHGSWAGDCGNKAATIVAIEGL